MQQLFCLLFSAKDKLEEITREILSNPHTELSTCTTYLENMTEIMSVTFLFLKFVLNKFFLSTFALRTLGTILLL